LKIIEFFRAIWEVIKKNTPAILLAFFNFEEYRVKQAQVSADKSEYEKELLKNEKEVNDMFAGVDDSDVIDHFDGSVGISGSNGSDPGPEGNGEGSFH